MAKTITGLNVGNTTITAYYTDGGVTKSSSINFTVTQADGFLTATTTNRTFNGSNQTIATIATNSGTYYFGLGSSTTSQPSSWGNANTDLQAKNAGTYYVWGKCDASTNYNAVAPKYIATVTIAKREVAVTAPSINSTTLTYNKQAQNLTTGGSCGTGGTMYYYASKTNSTPTFSTSTWTTGAAKGTDAGTYYIWYYCYVSDTANNKSAASGTAINTVTKLSGTKEILQKTATLSWGTSSWTYDGSTHSTTCSVGNLESGDTCSVTLTGNSVGKNVGSATVTASSLSNANYKLPSSNTKSISITQKEVTLTWSTTTSWVYDGTAHSVTCTAGGLVTGDTCTVNLTNNSITNVGSVTVTASSLSNSNYKLPSSGLTKSISVTAKAITFKADDETWTYDKATHSAGNSATRVTEVGNALVSGHTATFTCTGSVGANVGTATKTLSTVTIKDASNNDVTSNYNITKQNGTLSITAKEVTLSWGTVSWTYDGSSHSTTCTAGSLCTGDTCTVTLSNNSVGPAVGSQTVTASSLSNSNYKLPSAKTKSISITAKAVTYTADNESWTYDKATHSASNSATLTTGSLVSDHKATFTCTGSVGPDVGTATKTLSAVVIKDASNNVVTGNYTITKNSGTLTINQKAVTLTWGTASWTYDGSAHSTTCTAGSLCTGDTCTVTLSNNSVGAAVGSKTVTASGLSNGNYKLPSSGTTKSISITQREVTLSWGTTSWAYDGSSHSTTCTAGNLVGTDTCTVTLSGNSVGPAAGTATVTASSLSNSNYKLPSAKTATLTISGKAVTFKADNESWVYDKSSHSASNTATLTAGSLLMGHTATFTCTGSIGPNVPSSAATKTLSTVTIKDGSNNDVTANYTITKQNGTLNITQKEVSLTWGTASWTYDGAAHSTTCTAGNLCSGDTCTVTLNNNSVGAAVGSKTVTATGLSNANYKLPSSGTTKSISITAKEVTLTWGTASWTYDGASHSTTCTAGNLVSGDTCTVTLTNNSVGPAVGSQTVTASSLSNSNYKLPSAKTKSISISARAVTYKADNQSWVYDGSTHSASNTATLTSGSLVSGHSASFTCTGSVGAAVPSSAATKTLSTVTIKDGSNNDVSSNYTITKQNGTLNITQREVTLSWGTTSWTYDGNAHSTTCTAGNLVSGDTCTVTLTGNTITNVGSTTVTASSLSNANYKLPSAKTATLTVSARTVTVTAPTFVGSTLTYNGSNQTIINAGSASTGGTMYYYVSTSSTKPTVSGTPGTGWTTTPPQKKDAGTYYAWYYVYVSDTTNNSGSGINTVTALSGNSKVIGQKTVSLSWGTVSWMYDGSAHSTTCTAGSLASGDSCTVTLTGNSITNKGTTTVTASSLSNSNYKLPSAKTATLTITARTVTYTADNESWTYNNTSHSASNSATRSGNTLVSGHTATITCSGSVGPGVGSATKTLESVVIKNSGGTDVSTNYDIILINGTLTITAAAISIPSPTGVTVTYDAASHAATFPTTSGADITNYRWSTTDGSSWTTSSTNPGKVNAGTYYVQAYYTADGNHSGSGWSSSATVKINKRSVTITGGTASRAYNGSALTYASASEPTLTGAVSGHHIHSYDASGTITYVGSANVTISNATIYSGTHNGTETNQTSNYTISYSPGTLTITKANPTVTVTGVTQDYTGGQFYATAKSNIKGTLYWKRGSAPTVSSNDGSVSIDTVNTNYNVTSVKDNSDDFTMYYLFVPSSAANSLSSGHTCADNYNNASGNKALTINPRNISNVSATATAVTYNGSSQTGTVTVTDSGATLTSSDYTISGNTGTDAGDYTVTITGQNNYTGTKTITWKINKRATTVTAGSDSKVYDGTALTKNSATASNLPSGQHLHSYTITGSQTSVGTSNNVPSVAKIYKGTHSGTESDVTSNYTITYANGTLEVTARTVTITAPTFSTGTLTYNGSAKTIASGGSCTTGGTMYYYISTTNSTPTFSTSTWSTNATIQATNAGTYYVWYYCKVDDTTNNTGTGINTVKQLSGSRTIGQRTVTVTAPVGTTVTYNGSEQTIFTGTGSCTTGGVMYYSTSNSTFSTSTWTTTFPYTKKTTAGTYTIYWYCYVSDTANNTGSNINTKKSVQGVINKASGSITYENVENITIDCTDTAGAASNTDVAKTLEVATASASGATGTVSYSISQSGWSISSDGLTITVPANAPATTYDITITATSAPSTNYKEAHVTNNVTVVINPVTLTSIVMTLGANTVVYGGSTTVTSVRANYSNGQFNPDVQAQLTPNASSGNRIVSGTPDIVEITAS